MNKRIAKKRAKHGRLIAELFRLQMEGVRRVARALYPLQPEGNAFFRSRQSPQNPEPPALEP